ncbi:trypsin-like serine protease [Planomonospora sp. ID67723]|uniref:trypsin-like serine peptidase n=1 Tax=Planomonospora sp. ID67723 TaxID=2738134 RepID=UPI0018C42250|nr:trypsin-like serine protease [Planomonospora sp. ID67723]MBG0832160.1 trypsin-like serine protease [Planomonospora sp. ID67723]
MSPRARRLATTLGAFLAACVTATSAFAGSAAAGPYESVPNGVVSIELTKSGADMKRIAEYWNPGRLKEAQDNTPATPEVKPTGTASSAPASPTPSGAGTASAASAGPGRGSAKNNGNTKSGGTAKTGALQTIRPTFPKKRPPGTGVTPITVGKVFFRLGGKDYWCSASSVASTGRNLVATAAHCAYDARQGRTAEHWIFIPGYDKGATPYGIYVGHSLNLHDRFVGWGDYDYDYAFISVHDGFRWKPGKTAGSYEMESVGSLEDNVGGQGLTVRRGVGLFTFAFGYPAAPHNNGSRPYDGQNLKRCDGRTGKRTAPARLVEYGIALTCTFTAGASGGPWLVDYDLKHAAGYLNGVNSFTWDTDVNGEYDLISSPYFTASTLVVYRWAESRKAPQP